MGSTGGQPGACYKTSSHRQHHLCQGTLMEDLSPCTDQAQATAADQVTIHLHNPCKTLPTEDLSPYTTQVPTTTTNQLMTTEHLCLHLCHPKPTEALSLYTNQDLVQATTLPQVMAMEHLWPHLKKPEASSPCTNQDLVQATTAGQVRCLEILHNVLLARLVLSALNGVEEVTNTMVELVMAMVHPNPTNLKTAMALPKILNTITNNHLIPMAHLITAPMTAMDRISGTRSSAAHMIIRKRIFTNLRQMGTEHLWHLQ